LIVAYLLNQYPRTAQAAMRREILALEALGLTVDRYTLRYSNDDLVEEADLAERERARAVLSVGAVGLLRGLLASLIAGPKSFLRAARLAWTIGRRSERGLPINLIYLAEACVLRRWLAESGARHLHAHYGTNSAAVAMLCRVLGGPPYSFTMHGPEEFDSPRALSLADKIHHAAFVVAICEFTRSQLYRWAAYEDWPKVRVVHCGVDDLFLGSGPTPVPDVPRFINVGRVAEQKGQMLLIEAVHRLRAEGIDCELVIVGDGPLRAAAERLIQRLGLAGRVQITGYLSNREVLREIRESRALVLPSFAEGLPGVFFEAFALGRPVIGTYIAGTPELVEPGASGWLVPAGSVEALVDAMREALAMPVAELEAMGREGALRVAEHHDALTEAGKLAELFAGSPAPDPNGRAAGRVLRLTTNPRGESRVSSGPVPHPDSLFEPGQRNP
jgi:colanic acid/amylovoran biosynthesis glycosyltransferase